MKKIIYLMLCFLLCFCMSGCKSKDIYQGSSATDMTAAHSKEENKKEKFSGESDYLKAATGVWKFCSKLRDTSEINTIEISKNYTLNIDGRKGTWDFSDAVKSSDKSNNQNINYFKIDAVMDDGETYNVNILKYKKGDSYDRAYTLRLKDYNFVKNSDFDIVEINLENYNDYFEIKDYFMAYKDKFGDYTGNMSLSVYLTSKDGIEVCDSWSKIEYKYSFSIGCYGFEFNQATGEYKLQGNISSYDTINNSYGSCSMREDGKYAGLIDGATVCETDPGEYATNYPENINITGIIGILYIYK